MSDEYGPNFITLTDEDGQEITLEYVDALEHNGQTYMAFFPTVTEDMDEAAAEDYGLVILKSVTENGEELLSTLVPDLWGKFPLFKPPMIWYNRGEPGRPGSPPRCIQAFFILTFGYTGCRISMWFAGLPAAFRGWKLEAVKQAGDNPPAEMVQVITGSVCIAFLCLSPLPKRRLSCIIAGYAKNNGRFRPFFERNEYK